MLVLNSPQVVQETAIRWKREHKVALVPTMGALHEGHLRLVAKAKEYGQKVIVSLFVNPMQFGANEDLAKYPRTFEEDQEKLDALDVDVLFAPDVEDIYSKHFDTKITVGNLSKHFEGKSRPGHFEGVTTICMKLFQISQADFAVFGEKDFQQLRVLQKMTEDLNLPLMIVPHPTVREKDGLAMSSRNRYLTEKERATASHFPRSLKEARARGVGHPEATVGEILAMARAGLRGMTVDYLDIVSERDLAPLKPETRLADISLPRMLAAVKVGQTRLLDNVALHGETE